MPGPSGEPVSERFELDRDDGVTLSVQAWKPDGDVRGVVQILHGMSEYGARYGRLAGVLTAVCDHRTADAASRLRSCLAESSATVGGTLHIPLDKNRDLYAIALRGVAESVQSLAGKIQAMRGIRHAQLSVVLPEE